MPTASAPSPRSAAPVSLETERTALARARSATLDKLYRFAGISGGGADEFADEYIDAVVAGAIEQLQRELVVFGRIDDEHVWRIGLYGVDSGADQLVVDWRAPFAGAFYQARLADPMGLAQRVTYVGCIDDLFIEDFSNGEVSGSSPLLTELSRSRGTEMRTAVATLQSEQDDLVRLAPTERLVLRGGPGTGKTVVGLHRAAWLVYNDTRLTAGRILVIGPSDKFLRFVAAVLPTLGEARITQTTFDRLLGPSTPAGSDERWLGVLDRFEASLFRPAELRLGLKRVPEADIAERVERLRERPMPWRDRRKVFVAGLANQCGVSVGEAGRATGDIWPAMSARQAMARLRRRSTLVALGMDSEWIDEWCNTDVIDGAFADEVTARFDGVPATYGHVIVDEAQDLSLLQLRAVMRRSDGLTLVGDDAQRSNPAGIGLGRAAQLLDGRSAVMATAYRMSAEIADWLNAHAAAHDIPAVELLGIRPTGRPVLDTRRVDVEGAAHDLRARWDNVAVIRAGAVWEHKGVEYDGVVVDAAGMDPSEMYLAASRAAHELVIAR
ncbi:MAG: AAA family ATPase [Acidimicrobiales bacterium]